MKKLLSIFATILLFSTNTFSQILLKNFYFGINVKNKADLYTTKKDALFLGNSPIIVKDSWLEKDRYSHLYYKFTLGYNHRNKHRIELGWTFENYSGGFRLPYLMSGFHKSAYLYTVNIEDSDNYSLRYGYAFGNQKLKIIPSCAYTLLKSSSYIHGAFPFNGIYSAQLHDPQGKEYNIIYQARDIQFIDYGLRPYGHTINGQLDLEYSVNKYLAFNIAGGYTHGFNTMGYYNVRYKITDYPEQNGINAVTGTHYYYSIGLKLYPFAKKQLLITKTPKD